MDAKAAKTDVVLLSAPYDDPPRPSLALSLFKPLLVEAGFSCRTLYPMVRMRELMGEQVLRELGSIRAVTLYEEVLFSGLTGSRRKTDLEGYAALVASRVPEVDPHRFVRCLRHGMDAAGQIVEETARAICELSPSVLAASSLFAQQNASLAILGRVRELRPDIRTLMGGPNCAGEAGRALLKWFPQVDAVFFGEGDEVFAEVIQALKTNAPLPYGVLRKSDLPLYEHRKLPYRLTRDMNTVPVPDFGDFLACTSGMQPPDGKAQEMVILLEGSRGCWWGEKHPCTFCALNGEINRYRAKTPERIFEEMMLQTSRYHTRVVEFTDNVLSQDAIRQLPAMMKASGRRFAAMAEVKPNLTEAEVAALRQAGFRYVQPGLESLNDHLIRLMGKGSTAVGHIAFLKACRRSGLIPLWNFLYRIPGEEAADYEELFRLLPLLHHLPAPTGFSRVFFERGSCYTLDPERYALALAPDRYYRYAFGDNEEIVRAFALYYEDVGGKASEQLQALQPLHDRLVALIRQWQAVYRRGDCHLVMQDRGDYLVMRDTRPCRKTPLLFLTGAARALCLACNTGLEAQEAEKRVSRTYPLDAVREAVRFLQAYGYLVCLGGRCLTLATLGEEPPERREKDDTDR